MNREDIIKLAREAGMSDGWSLNETKLERFAALVAAPLQERIQDLYRQLNEAERELDSQYKLGMEAERRARAKVCDAEGLLWGQRYVDATRSRGNT